MLYHYVYRLDFNSNGFDQVSRTSGLIQSRMAHKNIRYNITFKEAT